MNYIERDQFVEALSRAIDKRDPTTWQHSARMSQYVRNIVIPYSLTSDKEEALYIGCKLHDIGKIGIPDSILNKRGKFTPSERTKMERHAEMGYDILSGVSWLVLIGVVSLVRNHHEKLDGSGYPDCLRDTMINDILRIITVLDMYDGLRGPRPYRYPPEIERPVVISILREEASKGRLDYRVVCIVEERIRY